MKFSAVLDRHFTRHEIFGLLRILNGISFIIYYVFVLCPHWNDFFSSHGLIDPDRFGIFPGSWLHSLWAFDGLKLGLFVVTLILFLFYTFGYYARWAQIFLLPLILGFHNANPLINHEPQQLNNLLLLLLLFCPIEARYVIRKCHWRRFWRPITERQ
ncbi:MAG: hypothetical protein ACJ76H_17095, partial [Bacteriovoracaceae bacterium]